MEQPPTSDSAGPRAASPARRWPTAAFSPIRPVAGALVLLLWLGADYCRGAVEAATPQALERDYTTEVRPLLKQYCFDCHSAEKHKGDIDMEGLASFEQARSQIKTWEKAWEMLHTGEMPPKKKAQPTPTERERLEEWLKQLLHAEALQHAGDPGRVLLRRLSNVEYTLTVRDLTGVPLDPAKEFPVDGAAGEGFVNVGEALVMSPSLLDKYLAAAKEIANHAVLLPDGFRFEASTRKGDWVDERLKAIREFYARYTDAQGGQRINLQGIVFDTNTGGRLPVEEYLAATLDEREALSKGIKTPQDVAKARGLNGKYMAGLWALLTNGEPSPLLDAVRARWRTAPASDAGALAGEIAQWQKALTKFQTVGHMRPWVVPVDPLMARQEIRFKIPTVTNQNDVTLYLAASDAGDGTNQDVVIWENPRLVRTGQPDLPLREVRAYTEQLLARRERLVASAAACLAAAAEAAASNQPLDRIELARRHQVDADLLSLWFDYLGLGSGHALKIEGYFTNQLKNVSNYDFIKGWGLPETPSVVANSSDQHVRIPGNMKPHGVAMHPSPTLNVAVGWRSPVTGPLRVEAAITHAHPECGNGVTWSLELRRGATRQRLAAGTSQGGKEVKAGPIENVVVRSGDLLSLLIGPRDGNHSCDLTDVELIVHSARDDRSWKLTQDVSPDILAANPHADRFGNEGIWHFYAEPVAAGAEVGPVIPSGSLLARWQAADSLQEKEPLAKQVQTLLRGPAPADPASPEAALYRQITSLGGPLLAGAPGADAAAKKGNAAAENATQTHSGEAWWGPPAEFFGHLPSGAAREPASLCVQAPAVLEIHLPAELVNGAELVTTGTLDGPTGQEGSVQLQVTTSPPRLSSALTPDQATVKSGTGPWGSDTSRVEHSTPIIVHDGSPARSRFEAGFDEFRRWFPSAVCYTKIVPVDEVITLTVFHREDEPLCRLMLSDEAKAELDRLWEELHFIGQDALTMVDAYAQLLEYASQDSDPKLFAHLRQPITERAAAFRQEMASAEPRQLEALIDFAGRAFRRPLAQAEKDKLRRLYGALREEPLPHEEAFRLTLARVLVSPSFLYRIEQPPAGATAQPVSDWEMANRLSYFLWSSMPDETLRTEAAAGRLHDPDAIVSQVRRMIHDKRVRALATEFACQWLHIRDFDSHDEKSPRYFPTFAALRGDMYEESVQFFMGLFQRDESVLEILNSDHTYLNEALAKHYQVPGVTGPEWRRVEGIQRYGRGGILGMASVLAKQSGASRTSPILRGNWVVETLLGDKIPKPPPNVPQLPETEADTGALTVREITAQHTTVPECAACHIRIDPFGFALEKYDAIGRYREADLAGRPIDARARLQYKDDAEFEGLPGLRDYLLTKRRDEFVRTFCRKLLGYALGRGLQLSDTPLVEEMQQRLSQNNYRFSVALETIVRSPQFQNHRGLEATRAEEL